MSELMSVMSQSKYQFMLEYLSINVKVKIKYCQSKCHLMWELMSVYVKELYVKETVSYFQSESQLMSQKVSECQSKFQFMSKKSQLL